MKHIHEFLLESTISSYPLQILMRGNIGLTTKTEDFTRNIMNYLYDNYIRLVLIKGDGSYNTNKEVPKNRRKHIDFQYPILNFTSQTHDFLEDSNATIYNKLNDYEISSDKKLFYQALDGICQYIPKAVYSLDDIEDLQLPIIAKPSDGFSAQGIEKFDSYEDARNSDLQFDTWTECKDIIREFRAFILNNKVIFISERITNTKNDKSVGKKDPDEKIDLIYIDQEIDSFKYLDEINTILSQLKSKVNLDFYNIDLMLDANDKLWVPEINGAPGIGPSHFYEIYKEWLKFAYDKEIDDKSDKDLYRLAKEHFNKIKDAYPDEYKYSLNPKKYS